MSNILFKHDLSNAWGQSISSITIIDSDKDNVIINNKKYNLPVETIDKIKELLTNKDLYINATIMFPPILDGTSHTIKLGDKKTLKGFSLWYWNEEDSFNTINVQYTEKDVLLTKSIVDLINKIQEYLYMNNIDFYIIDAEVEE